MYRGSQLMTGPSGVSCLQNAQLYTFHHQRQNEPSSIGLESTTKTEKLFPSSCARRSTLSTTDDLVIDIREEYGTADHGTYRA